MTDRTPAAEAAYQFGRDLHRLASGIAAMEQSMDEFTAPIVAAEDWPTLATHAAIMATLKARLGSLENTVATVLGKGKGRHVGTLADGSRYTVERSADRKAWSHDDWKRDVRREVTTLTTINYVPTVVNTATGEEESLASLVQKALAMAQEVHGSQAPKSKALTGLGLFASDYSDSTPGPWRVSFVKPDLVTPAVPPATKTTTTTEK